MGQFDPIQAPMPEPIGNPDSISGGDPNAMGADPNAAADPNADPNAMGADPMADGEAEGGDDSTASIIDQLSDDDKEAVRNYAKSLLNRDEANAGETPGMEEPAPAPDQAGQGVMMEITKGRLKKVQQKLNETFRGQEDEREKPRTQKKVHATKEKGGKKSPFSSPFI